MAPRGENRTKLIEAMQNLALSKGFPATTVDEVCVEADVSKGSFYHYFETKEAIGYAALDHYFDDLVAALTTGPFTEADSSIRRLRGFVEQASTVCAGPLLRNGCMLGSFALDLAESDAGIQAKLSSQFDVLCDYVADLITEAASETETALAAPDLAKQFLAIIEGSIVLAKAYANPAVLTSGVALFADHLALLFGKEIWND